MPDRSKCELVLFTLVFLVRRVVLVLQSEEERLRREREKYELEQEEVIIYYSC